jgi:DCN1-like protein 1/2
LIAIEVCIICEIGIRLRARRWLISTSDAPGNNPDGIGIEGVMKYFGDINIELDEVACFGIAELLKSPTMGEFTREGFIEGWKLAG